MASLSSVVQLLCAVAVLAATAQSGSPRPHIVFILADDLGWDDISLHGSQQILTPNLDALAADGILLNNYYVQPICTPSRAALLTGKHPIHLGLQHNTIPPPSPYGLGLREKILPQYLNTLGYESHMVGKWHLGFFAKEYTPMYRGFKSHFGYYNGCEDYLDHTLATADMQLDQWGLDFWNDTDVMRTAFGQYSTELFTARAEWLIRNHNADKPLFLYLPHQAVHSGNPGVKGTKLQAPWKYLQKFDYIQSEERRRLAGMISALDDSVGNITQALHAKGMLNNTILVFSTDNGGPADRFDFNCASNWPLRGGKRTMWEGGVRGNGFIWSPLLHTSRYTSEHMISILDWLPTLLDAAGYDVSQLPRDVEGVSQWRALSENGHSVRHGMLHNIDPITGDGGLRWHDMKVVYGGGNTKQHRGWYPPEMLQSDYQPHPEDGFPRSPQETRWNVNQTFPTPMHLFKTDLWEVFHQLGRSPEKRELRVQVKCGPVPSDVQTNCKSWIKPCLFNITADPCEYHNLAEKHPKILHKLMSYIRDYNASAKAPYDNSADPKAFPGNHGGLWMPWVNL